MYCNNHNKRDNHITLIFHAYFIALNSGLCSLMIHWFFPWCLLEELNLKEKIHSRVMDNLFDNVRVK